MKKDDYDKLREKLGLDELDKNTKKKLLEQFQKVGGKVDYRIFDKKQAYLELLKNAAKKKREAEELRTKKRDIKSTNLTKKKKLDKKKSIQKNTTTSKNKTLKHKNPKINKANPKSSRTKTSSIAQKRKSSSDLYKQKKLSKNQILASIEKKKNKIQKVSTVYPSLIDKFLFSINGYLLNVTKLRYLSFNTDFILSFYSDYINTVSKLCYFIKTCINSTTIFNEIKKKSIKINDKYIDILYHFNTLLDEDFFKEFQNVINNSLSTILPGHIFRKFSYYFKRLYFLFLNKTLLKEAILFTFNVYKNFFKSTLNEQEIIDNLDFILDTSVKKFHLLFSINYGKYVSLRNFDLTKILNFGEEEVLGYYLRKIEEQKKEIEEKLKNVTKEEKEALEKEIEEKEEKKIPKDVKIGFRLMDNILEDYQLNWDKIVARDRILPNLEKKDKIFWVYLFFKEFMDEYSIFFPSKSIQYKIDYVEHKKVDVKEGLNEALNSLTIILNNFDAYVDLIKKSRQYENTSWSGLEDRLKNERIIMSKDLRNHLAEELKSVLKNIIYVLKDYKSGEKKIILNPDNVLSIDTSLMGKRKFNKERIIKFFTLTYYFLKGFIWRLENTDFSGSDLEIDEPLF